MAKQLINVGTTPNDRKGDSLRAAFAKINANFDELYSSLSLDNSSFSIGSFEFEGSSIRTTDSTPVVIEQSASVTGNLTIGGDVLPETGNSGDLGSVTNPWRSLYVSEDTIFLKGVSLRLDTGTNSLKINDVPISQTINYTDILNVPTDISEFTDNQGLLNKVLDGGGASTVFSSNDINIDGGTASTMFDQTIDGGGV